MDMLKSKIQFDLLKAGIQQIDVAKRLRTTSTTIHNVCTFKTHCKRVQDYVACILGESAEILFGHHYAPIWYQQKEQNKNKKLPPVGEAPTDVSPG